jgi:hypothetical protein
MNLKIREAPDRKLLNQTQIADAKIVTERISRGHFYGFSSDMVANQIGPLTVAQRWESAPDFGFNEQARTHVNWEGSACIVASRMVGYAGGNGYPQSAELADLAIRIGDSVGKKVDDENIDTAVRKALLSIFGN